MSRSSRNPRWRRHRPPTCAHHGCHEPHADGSLFCVEHGQPLAAIRAELTKEGREMHERGGATRMRAKRRGSAPTCCMVGCHNLRTPPHTYCSECEAQLEEDV